MLESHDAWNTILSVFGFGNFSGVNSLINFQGVNLLCVERPVGIFAPFVFPVVFFKTRSND